MSKQSVPVLILFYPQVYKKEQHWRERGEGKKRLRLKSLSIVAEMMLSCVVHAKLCYVDNSAPYVLHGRARRVQTVCIGQKLRLVSNRSRA
jgi:hypothetical protein